MKRSEKEQFVRQWAERLQKATAVVLADYRGLKVSELTALRREVRKSEGELRVVKNRLIKRVLEGSPWSALGEYFKGPTAMAVVGGDLVPLTKVLVKYVENLAAFKLRVGFFGGRLISAKEIEGLSKLPSREELYARLLGVLQAPMVAVARALKAVPQKLVRSLKEIEKTKGG